MSSTRAAEAPPAGAGRRASPAPAGLDGGLAGCPVSALVRGSLRFPTRGYAGSPREVTGDALFDEHHHDMVIVRDIETHSLRERHTLAFFGRVHIACIPNGRIPGLPKTARLVELCARRLQVRERLTERIAGSLREVARPRGVRVVVEAYDLCMMMRGTRKQDSFTISSAARGSFLREARTTDESLRLCGADRIPVG